MRLYTVHVPVSAEPGSPAFERAQFVRDGFNGWAFVFSALWCVWHGMWVAAAAVIVLSATFFGVGRVFGLPLEAQLLLQFVLAVFLGLEAPNLRRFTLNRRGLFDAGAIAAADEDEAEGLFFARAPERGAEAKPPFSPVNPASTTRARFVEDIVGLFPEHRGR
jgi:hypothetical protein